MIGVSHKLRNSNFYHISMILTLTAQYGSFLNTRYNLYACLDSTSFNRQVFALLVKCSPISMKLSGFESSFIRWILAKYEFSTIEGSGGKTVTEIGLFEKNNFKNTSMSFVRMSEIYFHLIFMKGFRKGYKLTY